MFKPVEHPTFERVVFTGGASGGHFFPLVALLEYARQQWPHIQACFIGSTQGIESSIAPQYPWQVAFLPVQPFRDRALPGRIRSGWFLIRSTLAAHHLLRRFRPDLVIGSGSYASVPAALAARYLKCPLILHEQNVYPGQAIRWMMKWARGIALTYPPPEPLPIPHECVGNPVRKEFFHIPNERPPWPPFRILIVGGSQGSRFLNERVPEAIHHLTRTGMVLEVFHQTGPRDVEKVADHYRQIGIRAHVQPFFNPMADIFARVHLVIARAGSTTLAELAAAQMAAILVPLEGLAGNHQLENARFFAEQHAALLYRQDDPVDHLVYLIADVINHPETWRQLRMQMGQFARIDAAERFWSWVHTLLTRT